MSFLVVQHEFSVGTVADHISDELVVALGSSRFIDDMSVVFTRDDGLLGEYPGIRKVWEAAQDKNGPSHIGYWHTKGASHPFNPCVHDWRRYMMYFFLRGPSLEHDVTGVNWNEDPAQGKWFAGNLVGFDRVPQEAPETGADAQPARVGVLAGEGRPDGPRTARLEREPLPHPLPAVLLRRARRMRGLE